MLDAAGLKRLSSSCVGTVCLQIEETAIEDAMEQIVEFHMKLSFQGEHTYAADVASSPRPADGSYSASCNKVLGAWQSVHHVFSFYSGLYIVANFSSLFCEVQF